MRKMASAGVYGAVADDDNMSLKFDSKTLEIKTKSIEQTLVPLVTQVSRFLYFHGRVFCSHTSHSTLFLYCLPIKVSPSSNRACSAVLLLLQFFIMLLEDVSA